MLNLHSPPQRSVIFGVAVLGGLAGLGRVFMLVLNHEHPNIFDLAGNCATGAFIGLLVASAFLTLFQPQR